VLPHFRWSGTHRGEFFGIPATHRVVQVWGMVIDRFEGEKVTSTRILMDRFGLLQQLGAVSTTPEAGVNPHAAR
jgi:predicted ester cyclase